MSAGIVQLRSGGRVLTGTGTITVNDAVVAGYLNTNGTDTATVELRETDASGPLIFKWNSPIATAIWPTVCAKRTVYYSVSGTDVFVLLHEVVI